MKHAVSRKSLTLQEVKLPLCEIGVTGPTRMDLQKLYDAYRRRYNIRQSIVAVEHDYNVSDVQVDASGKTIVFYKNVPSNRPYDPDLDESTLHESGSEVRLWNVQREFDIERKRGGTVREIVRRVEKNFGLQNVRMNPAGTLVVSFELDPAADEAWGLGESWHSMTPDFEWGTLHPGYEFVVIAHTRSGRQRIGTDAVLPKARVLARRHYANTGERVEVFDQQGRKYFTLG